MAPVLRAALAHQALTTHNTSATLLEGGGSGSDDSEEVRARQEFYVFKTPLKNLNLRRCVPPSHNPFRVGGQTFNEAKQQECTAAQLPQTT